MAKKPTESSGDSLESRLKHLEEIIERLGEGEMPLEEANSLYQEGMQLVKQCRRELKEARGRVERLNRETGKLEPLESA